MQRILNPEFFNNTNNDVRLHTIGIDQAKGLKLDIPDDAIIVSSPLVLDESRYPTLVGAGQWIHVY